MPPELSYGSHFFQDLVEDDIFYATIFENNEKVLFNKDFINCEINLLEELLPEAKHYQDIIRVCDIDNVHIKSRVKENMVMCY
jgi:hypothetical protein